MLFIVADAACELLRPELVTMMTKPANGCIIVRELDSRIV